MNIKKIFVLGLAFIFISSSYAGNQDSVMSVPNIYAIPNTISYSSVTPGVVIGSNTTTEKETDLCPAGMTGPTGGPTYVKRTRQIVNYINLNLNILLGSILGNWQETHEECTKTETRQIACGAGFTGTITQKRLVIGVDLDLLFKDWETSLNLCVAIPLEICDPVDLVASLGLNSSFLYGGAPYDGKFLGNVWEGAAVWRGESILGDLYTGTFAHFSTYAELEAALRLKGFKIVNMTNPYASDNWFGLFSAGLCKIL